MIRSRAPLLTVLPTLALVLAGCVSQGPFPSLAPRPAEGIDMTIEPVREMPVVADDPALRERIAAFVGEARDGAREFDAALPATERAMARAGAHGSESWVAAQQSMSRLESARSKTTMARAALDQFALELADRPLSAADRDSAAAAVAEVERIVVEQQARIDRLRRD